MKEDKESDLSNENTRPPSDINLNFGSENAEMLKEENDFFTLHVFENNYGAVTFYENRGLIKKEESVHEDLGEVEYLMYYRKKKKEEK